MTRENRIKEKGRKELTSNKIGKWKRKANTYIKNKEKSKELLEQAEKKAREKRSGPLGDIWDNVQSLFSLFHDWTKGNYKEIPTGSILMVAVGLIYFVTPIDAFLDTIPLLGLIDDAAVLGAVIKQIGSELEDYKEWKSGQDDRK